MKEWFAGLNPRERHILIAGGFVTGLLLLYQLVWSPLSSGVEKRATQTMKLEQQLDWMRQSTAEIRQLRGSRSGTGALPPGQSLLGLTQQTARKQLGSAIKKMQAEGQNGVRMWLEDASFDAIMQWLDILQFKYAIVISDITLEQRKVKGKVNARILLETPE